MKIIIYYHIHASLDGEHLVHVIEKKLPYLSTEVFCGIEALQGRLQRPSLYPEQDVFLLLANSYSQLSDLLCLAGQIEGKRMILIVTSDLMVFLKKSLLLYPRFIAILRTDYKQLCRVLEKMTTFRQRLGKNARNI
jgi:hypothetical protein